MKAFDVLIALSTELPNPGSPLFVPWLTVVAGVIAGAVSRARAGDWRHARDNGMFLGGSVGLTCWLVLVAIDRL